MRSNLHGLQVEPLAIIIAVCHGARPFPPRVAGKGVKGSGSARLSGRVLLQQLARIPALYIKELKMLSE